MHDKLLFDNHISCIKVSRAVSTMTQLESHFTKSYFAKYSISLPDTCSIKPSNFILGCYCQLIPTF